MVATSLTYELLLSAIVLSISPTILFYFIITKFKQLYSAKRTTILFFIIYTGLVTLNFFTPKNSFYIIQCIILEQVRHLLLTVLFYIITRRRLFVQKLRF